jgi:hypothetical protein
MRTRTSPRNQEILWRALGAPVKRDRAKYLHYVVNTVANVQTLSCGHTRELPAMWAGRVPARRLCFICSGESNAI